MAEQNNNPNPNQDEKLFPQTELDAIIGRRLSEERAKYPSADELNQFRAWQTQQQAAQHNDGEDEKLTSLTAERDAANNKYKEAQAKLTKLEHEQYLSGKGISADDLDYYEFKIAKNVTDTVTFEQAADEFFKNNKSVGVRFDTAGSVGGKGGKPTPNETMNALIRGARK